MNTDEKRKCKLLWLKINKKKEIVFASPLVFQVLTAHCGRVIEIENKMKMNIVTRAGFV